MFLNQMLSHGFWFVLIATVIGLPSFIRKLVQALAVIQQEYNTEGRTPTMTPEEEKWVFDNIHYLRSRIDGPQQMSEDQTETNRMIRSQIRLSRLPGMIFIYVFLAVVILGALFWLTMWLHQHFGI